MLLNRWPEGVLIDKNGKPTPVFERWLTAAREAVNALQSGTQPGSGSPEGVVTAPVGTLWRRLDGGASTTLYIKEVGSGNTGWRAV